MGPESVPGRLEQAFGPAYLPLDAWKTEYNRCCGLLAGKNATSSIHGNVFPVASNSLDVVRTSCACVCASCLLYFSFFFFFVVRKGLSLSREHLPLLVVSM